MKIVGTGSKVIDADLLARLATDRSSGGSVSTAELQKTLKSVRTELKDQFDTSTRGLDRAALAVSNTLELAIDSGWIKAGSTQKAVEAFLEGPAKGSMKETLAAIREDVKNSRTGGTTYGGGGRVSGGGGVSRPVRTGGGT